MAPNLFLATQALMKPHTWFRKRSYQKAGHEIEHWHTPVPGTYERVPGRGWFLIATDAEGSLEKPLSVTYSNALQRYLLREEYNDRKRHGKIVVDGGRSVGMGLFRLDDGVTWVRCWDEWGDVAAKPWERWGVDVETGVWRRLEEGEAAGSLSASALSEKGDVRVVVGGLGSVNGSTGGYVSRGSTRPSTGPSSTSRVERSGNGSVAVEGRGSGASMKGASVVGAEELEMKLSRVAELRGA